MGLLSAISDSLDGLFRAAPGPPGGAMLSGGWYGGPMTLDAFGSKRAPTPYQLVESYKSLIYACSQINDNAVTRCKLRLYVDSGKGGQPRSACGPRRVARSEWQRLRSLPYMRSLVGGVGDVHEVTDHPAIDTLDHPDPEGYFDRQQLLSLINRYCDVVGVAYLKPDGMRDGLFPAFLWPLAAQYVISVSRPGTPLIDRYTYFAETYRFDELLRFRNTVSLRDPYKAGYSPTYAALEYAGLEDQYVSIQTTLLSGGARPSTAWVPTDPTMPPGDVERRRFEVDLDRQHARGNAGRHIVTNGAYTPHPLSYSPADLSGLDLSKYDMERTANCFGIPLPFLTGETNLANLQAAREQHAANAVEPRCKGIAAVLTRLCQKYDPRLFWAFDPCVPEDEERKAKISETRLRMGQTTINEENEEAQWLPKTWGDAPWLPGTLKQPDMITEAHQQGLETAKAATEKTQNETANADVPASDALAAKSDDGSEDRGLPAIHAAAVSWGGRPAMSMPERKEGESLKDYHRRIKEEAAAIRIGDRFAAQVSVDARFDAVLAAMEREMGL